MIINASIDLLKVNQSAIAEKVTRGGKPARYLELTFLENREGRDQYGNDGMVVQSTTKEERAAGKRGPILGNYKIVGVRAETPEQPEVEDGPPENDDVPF